MTTIKSFLNKYKKSLTYAAGALLFFSVADVAQAKQLKENIDVVLGNSQAIADLISNGAYLGGAGTAFMAAYKFKEHNENPQSVKLSKPMTYAAVAGLLLGLPTWMTTGADTMGFDQANSLQRGVLGGGK